MKMYHQYKELSDKKINAKADLKDQDQRHTEFKVPVFGFVSEKIHA